MPDHARMLVDIPYKRGVSSLVGYPREKLLLMFDRHAIPKHELGNRKFWAEGCHAGAVGPDENTIAKRVREQGRLSEN